MLGLELARANEFVRLRRILGVAVALVVCGGCCSNAAALADDVIMFDDLPVGTSITTDYLAQGVNFDSSVFISNDESNPTAPVLSGTPHFTGDIDANFTVPGTSTPTTVDGFSLDVGFIDSRDSVVVDYFDAGDQLVGTRVAQSLGINHLSIVYQGVASFRVHIVSDEPAGFGIDNLAVQRTAQGVRPVRMASLGDSYTAGEGLLPEGGLHYDCATDLHSGIYFQDTDLSFGSSWRNGVDCDTRTGSTTAPGDLVRRPPTVYENLCHRNRRAYPNQIRAQLGISGQNFIFTACSGAVTENVGLVSKQKAQYPHSPVNVHGGNVQITDLDAFAQGGTPDLLTIGIGGNDAGFGGIVKHCISPLGCTGQSFKDNTINKINGSVYDKLLETFEGLRADFPSASIVAFGYPSVIGDPHDDCSRVSGIDEDERTWLKEELLPTLNSAVSDAADAAGISFVDITSVTAGHEVCAKDNWINGIRGGDDIFHVLGNESFHPNQRAHDAIARYFIDHFTDGHGQLLALDPGQSDPLRPPPGPELTVGTVDAGAVTICGVDCHAPAPCIQACVIHLHGSGFAADTPLGVTLYSDPVTLGSVTTDDDGDVVADVQLPTGVVPGVHTIALSGTSQAGEEQTGVDLIQVHATDPRQPPTPTPDRTAPSLKRLRLDPSRFRTARETTPHAAHAKRRQHVRQGSEIALSLSESATVTFTISRSARGRSVGGHCRKPTRVNRSHRRCVRSIRVGTLVRHLPTGGSRTPFSGRLGRRALAPARYLLAARPVDAAGNHGRKRSTHFTIVRAHRARRR